MNEKKRGLGRGLGELGLSELLSDMSAPAASTQSFVTATTISPQETTTTIEIKKPHDFCHLAISELSPGRYQPRRNMDEDGLEELANSIRTQGIIQPIIVRRMNDSYEIIAGERRWRAAQLAGLKEVPAIVRDIPDETALAVALIENIQRRNLNSIEEAIALQRLSVEFSLTHQEIADAVGKTRTVVTNLLRLLKLNPDVRGLVESGELEMGHARALLALENADQSKAAQIVVSKKMSVRETEQLIKQWQSYDENKAKAVKPALDPNIKRLRDDLSEKLGAVVSIQHQDTGKGRLVIEYHSVDELDGIIEHVLGNKDWQR